MNRLAPIVGVSVAVASYAGIASAAVVVDFGSTAYNNNTATPLGRTAAGFSDTVPLSPAPSAGWATPAGKNSVFYGGFQLTGAGNRVVQTGGFDTAIRNDDTNGDFVQVRYAAPAAGYNNGQNTLATLMLFKQADFLNGGSSGVTLDSSTTFRTAVGANNNADAESVRLRLVMQRDGNYYIGRSSKVAAAGQPQQADGLWVGIPPLNQGALIAFDDVVWKAYDPATSIYMSDTDFNNATTYTGPFDNIGALGIYTDASRAAGTTVSADLRNAVRQFTVDAAVVPEPTSLGLLGAAGLLAFRRRRSL